MKSLAHLLIGMRLVNLHELYNITPFLNNPAGASCGKLSLSVALGTVTVNGIFQNLPVTIVEDISADKAKEIKGRLEAAGCTVELIFGD